MTSCWKKLTPMTTSFSQMLKREAWVAWTMARCVSLRCAFTFMPATASGSAVNKAAIAKQVSTVSDRSYYYAPEYAALIEVSRYLGVLARLCGMVPF